jgi:nucleoid-associated protein YgaU
VIPVRALAGGLALSAVESALVITGRGGPAMPPFVHPAGLPEWWRAAGPVLAVFSALRAGVLVIGAYGVLLLLLASAAGLAPGGAIARFLTSTRVWGARRSLSVVLGASVAGGVIAGCAPVRAPAETHDTRPGAAHVETQASPLLSYVGAGGPSAITASKGSEKRAASRPSVRAGLRRGDAGQAPLGRNAQSRKAPEGVLDHAAGPRTGATGVPHVTAQAGQARPAPPAASTARWTVRPGDNLWSIASAALSTRTGRQPWDRQVAAYWLDLIRANASRLPVPSDPSLIFPGDVVELPPFADKPAL